jgi:hypothetical protein
VKLDQEDEHRVVAVPTEVQGVVHNGGRNNKINRKHGEAPKGRMNRKRDNLETVSYPVRQKACQQGADSGYWRGSVGQ